MQNSSQQALGHALNMVEVSPPSFSIGIAMMDVFSSKMARIEQISDMSATMRRRGATLNMVVSLDAGYRKSERGAVSYAEENSFRRS